MTVHVHKDLSEIVIGDTRIKRDAKKRDKSEDTDRTWAFRGPESFEKRVLTDVAQTSNHPGGVPLTVAEEHLKVDMEARARTETARMTEALAGLLDERIKSGAA